MNEVIIPRKRVLNQPPLHHKVPVKRPCRSSISQTNSSPQPSQMQIPSTPSFDVLNSQDSIGSMWSFDEHEALTLVNETATPVSPKTDGDGMDDMCLPATPVPHVTDRFGLDHVRSPQNPTSPTQPSQNNVPAANSTAGQVDIRDEMETIRGALNQAKDATERIGKLCQTPLPYRTVLCRALTKTLKCVDEMEARLQAREHTAEQSCKAAKLQTTKIQNYKTTKLQRRYVCVFAVN